MTYAIDPGGVLPGSPQTCTVSQANTSGATEWVDLGDYTLSPGADLKLTNMVPGANGTLDIGFSAAVFEPAAAGTNAVCGGTTLYDLEP